MASANLLVQRSKSASPLVEEGNAFGHAEARSRREETPRRQNAKTPRFSCALRAPFSLGGLGVLAVRTLRSASLRLCVENRRCSAADVCDCAALRERAAARDA